MDAARAQPRRTRSPELDRPTDREREALSHVATGRSNGEVAAVLTISPATARTYVSRLLTKLGGRDRAQLVVIAHRAGIVAAQ
jgi:DNA-binding NarL/FixJ family response regulator